MPAARALSTGDPPFRWADHDGAHTPDHDKPTILVGLGVTLLYAARSAYRRKARWRSCVSITAWRVDVIGKELQDETGQTPRGKPHYKEQPGILHSMVVTQVHERCGAGSFPPKPYVFPPN